MQTDYNVVEAETLTGQNGLIDKIKKAQALEWDCTGGIACSVVPTEHEFPSKYRIKFYQAMIKIGPTPVGRVNC